MVDVASDVSSTNFEDGEKRVEVEDGSSTKSSGITVVVVLVVLDDLNNETICFGDISSALVVDALTVVVSDTEVDSSVDSSLEASWVVKVGVPVVESTTWDSNERDSLRKVQTPSTHSVHSWIQSSVPHSTLQIIPKRSKDASEPESSSELLVSAGSSDPRGLNCRFTPSSF